MMVSEAVKRYVDWRRTNGCRFERSARTLSTFLNIFPNLQMAEVEANHVLKFLNRKEMSTITWRLHFWSLTRFFEHWSNRGVATLTKMLTPRPFVRQTFVPYVFSSLELRALLLSALQISNSRCRIDGPTFRAAIIFLYGTGATPGEVEFVRRSDIDTVGGFVNIESTRPSRTRQIPIGDDLRRFLEDFMDSRPKEHQPNDYLFVNKQGLQVNAFKLGRTFRRVRKHAKVYRRDGSKLQPRVDDLRYTFAVHRITNWIDEGLDLNRMLPALAAYMGQIGIGSTQRYLFLTPERFRRDLDKLSPTGGRGMWCENQGLMAFLSSL